MATILKKNFFVSLKILKKRSYTFRNEFCLKKEKNSFFSQTPPFKRYSDSYFLFRKRLAFHEFL